MDGALIAGYPAYDSYRDSGEGWLEEVPAHWETRKLKQLFQEKRHRPNLALNCGAISFGEVVEKDDERIPLATKASYQEVLAGEFLVNPLNLNYDLKSLRIGLSDINVVVSAGYIVLQTKGDMDKRYFKYLLHRYDVAHMKLLGSGVRQTISFNHIANSILVAPPLPEQRAIAGFLDEKCARLDEAVRIKQAQIALLRERRQILIQQAVTTGLNPAAPMKDSHIDWIGQIPAHWDVVPLRRVSRIHAGNGFPVELQGDQDGTIPFMKVSDFSSTSILIASSNNYVSEKTIRSRKWNKVPRGSIVTAKIGEALRKNHRNILGVDAIIDNNCVGFEAVGMSKSYFFWLHKVIDFDWFVNPGAVPSISMQKYKGEKVPNPPIGEQVAIVEHIEAGCAMVDEGIAIKEDQIAALKEYKTSLINAAVTGKIKVA